MNTQNNRSYVVTETPDVEEYDAKRVLQLLADEETRTLFHHLSAPRTTTELIAECDIARSTAYRKIKELETAGLIQEVDLVDDTEQPMAYVRSFEEIVLRAGDSLTIEPILLIDRETVESIEVLLDSVQESLDDSQLAGELQTVRRLIVSRERSKFIEKPND